MYKVVVTDHVFKDLHIEQNIFQEIKAKTFDYNSKTEEETILALRDAETILTTAFQSFTKEFIGELDKCKVIVCYGIGVDNGIVIKS